MKLKTVINYLKSLKKYNDIYNAARYQVRKMIFDKNRLFFEKKLTESIGKPKDL